MKKCFVILAILAALWVSMPVQAQSSLRLASVTVNIWPEYDKPSVLVIYHLTLPDSATLPATLTLRVPAEANSSLVVAYLDPASSQLLNAAYTSSVQGEWTTLSITANSKEVQMEYYDALEKNGAARHFVYTWAGDYGVEAFSVALQNPVGATDIVTAPALTQSSVAQDGFTYYRSVPQPLAAGRTFTLTIDYQKSSDTLSTTGLPVQPTQPINANTPGRETTTGILWVLGGVGVALIVAAVAGGLFIWRGGTRHPHVAHKRHASPQPAGESAAVYCSQCGKRAQPEDVFCRTCGSRLRKEE